MRRKFCWPRKRLAKFTLTGLQRTESIIPRCTVAFDAAGPSKPTLTRTLIINAPHILLAVEAVSKICFDRHSTDRTFLPAPTFSSRSVEIAKRSKNPEVLLSKVTRQLRQTWVRDNCGLRKLGFHEKNETLNRTLNKP